MRNFIRELPDPLLDAARMEGAGELRIFWYVVLPLVRPAMAAMSVLVFTFVWNDYFWSLVLVQSDTVRPLTAGLQSLRGMWQTSWHLVCGGLDARRVAPGRRLLRHATAADPWPGLFRTGRRALAASVPAASYMRMGWRPACARGSSDDSSETGGGVMKSILDPSFRYVPSASRRTSARPSLGSGAK